MKRAIIILIMLVILIVSGCAVDQWTLVDEGALTNIEEIKGRLFAYAITFDDRRVVLLSRGYILETPPVVVLHQYYYLYKEVGRGTRYGYHLVEVRR